MFDASTADVTYFTVCRLTNSNSPNAIENNPPLSLAAEGFCEYNKNVFHFVFFSV